MGECKGPDPLLVTVCDAESWFVHVTVVPTPTVREPGENAKPAMLTCCTAAGAFAAVEEIGVVRTGEPATAVRWAASVALPGLQAPSVAIPTAVVAAMSAVAIRRPGALRCVR